MRPPLLLVGLFLASVAGLLWGAITIGGLTPLTYGNPGAMVGTSVFLVVNMALIIAATRRIIDPRFSGERRVSVRFPVDMAVRVDGHPARVEDVSLTGAQIFVRSDGAELGGTWTGGRLVDLDLYHQGLHLTGTAVRVQSRGDVGVELGVEFANGQWPAVRDLAVTLFHGNPDRKLTGDGAAWREAV